jgi:hypothetical protein
MTKWLHYLLYYMLEINWKIDALDQNIIGGFYFIMFIIAPILFYPTVGLWLLLVWCIVIPRVLYLTKILDYFSKKWEKS